MARIRTLKPEFFRSRSLARVSRDARLTFAGLWCEADDRGRGIADPRVLKGAIWPLDDDISWQQVDAHLRELEATGHIVCYEVDGDELYEVVSWEKHQASSYRRGRSVHPAPPVVQDARPVVQDHTTADTGVSTPLPGVVQNHDVSCKIVLEQGTGNRERGTGIAPAARARDPIFDALITAWSLDVRDLTATERGRVNKAVKMLREIGADPDEIPARKQMFQALWPDVTATMLSVVGRWAECRPDPARLSPRVPSGLSSIARAVSIPEG